MLKTDDFTAYTELVAQLAARNIEQGHADTVEEAVAMAEARIEHEAPNLHSRIVASMEAAGYLDTTH